MMGTAQLARLPVLDIGRRGETVMRAAHAAARGRGFLLRNGHGAPLKLLARTCPGGQPLWSGPFSGTGRPAQGRMVGPPLSPASKFAATVSAGCNKVTLP